MDVTKNSNISVVDTTTCGHLTNTDKPFILVLKAGENLFEGILRCAEKVNLKSASISGLGGLDDVTVAYFNTKTKQYQTKLFTGMFELISLNGNVSLVDGKHFVHIHAALGTEEYNVIGGHIMDATISPSGEITIIPLTSPIHREFDAGTGLKLMCPIR